MAALSFQPFVLRSFNAPLGADFLRNLSAKISAFFYYERDRSSLSKIISLTLGRR